MLLGMLSKLRGRIKRLELLYLCGLTISGMETCRKVRFVAVVAQQKVT